jgi:hypothetical protein
MPTYVAFFLPAYVAIGCIAYVLDLRWGVPLRRFFVNLVSAAPQDVTDGFLVGRKRSTQLLWAMAISAVLSVAMIALGLAAWYAQAVLALVEGLACFVGMLCGPLSLKAFRAVGIGLEKMDALDQTVRTDGKELLDGAISGAKQAAARVVDAITPDPDAPPPPTSEERRQEKIDRMDELLGKKKRERADG